VSVFSPYRAVLRTPHARGAFAASLTGRLCYGTVSLSLILTLTAGGRGYRFAGLVMAAFGVTVVLASPLRARLVDQYGPRGALPPLTAGFAAALVTIALIPARPGAGDVLIAVLAAAAGASAPPLGVVMRTLWGALSDSRTTRQAAYSLDGVAEELLYVAGPAIVGVLVLAARPATGLLVSAGLVVTGTALFLRSPALRRWPAAEPGPGRAPGSTEAVQPAAEAVPSATPGTGAAIVAVAFATGSIGLCLGGFGLLVVAFGQARHQPAAVAWIEASLAAGSALGGLGYGAVAWRVSARRRLVLLDAALAVILGPAALSPSPLVLAVLAGLAGTVVAPALATAYALGADLAPAAGRNRAGNWINSGYNAGSSAGSVLAGQLTGRLPLGACLPVLAGPALLAIVPLLRARLRPALSSRLWRRRR
jgi:MFS family permease